MCEADTGVLYSTLRKTQAEVVKSELRSEFYREHGILFHRDSCDDRQVEFNE